MLTSKNSFKIKGEAPMSYHIGCDFGSDDDGAIIFAPMKCIEKWLTNATTSLVLNPNSTSHNL